MNERTTFLSFCLFESNWSTTTFSFLPPLLDRSYSPNPMTPSLERKHLVINLLKALKTLNAIIEITLIRDQQICLARPRKRERVVALQIATDAVPTQTSHPVISF